MENLWQSASPSAWLTALERYEHVINGQRSARLPALDRWYRSELPGALRSRPRPHVTHAELVRVTEWKMARGVWRARNLMLVKGNAPALVEESSGKALALVPDPKAPITALAALDGVGPATASAIAAAYAPEMYPFFDELVAAQIPALGKVAFTPGYYFRYAAAIRERTQQLGAGWTPASVEQALWANSGGKIAAEAS